MDRENLLEIGVVLLGAGILAGVGLLVTGRVLGSTRHGRCLSEPPPAPGAIPSERHQQLATSPR